MSLLSFKKKDQSEIDNKETKEKADKAIQEATSSARKCLHSDLFKEYAKTYAGAEKAIIERIFVIDTREPDPLKYAFKMKEAIGELRHVKALFNSVRLKGKVIE